jgi:hypothetical protein
MALILEPTPDINLCRLSDHRYLPPEPDRTKHLNRSLDYLSNGAIRLNWSKRKSVLYLNTPIPEYKQPLLDLDRRPDSSDRVNRRRQLHRNRQRWSSERDEGQDLARSTVPLPSDNFRRPTRCPSLERQEAFRDPATSKRNLQASISSLYGDVDVDTAELYRLGLLYDDEHSRGSGFNLNTIVHEEPTFALRPSKRARKINDSRGCDLEQHSLQLDLSFAQLGQDDRIAQYLISPSPSEASDDETIQHRSEDRSSKRPPLKVIYELIEAEEINSQSSKGDHNAPPDLVSDSEDSYSDRHDTLPNYDNDSVCGLYDENDWALVLDENDSGEDIAMSGSAADNWVVLG